MNATVLYFTTGQAAQELHVTQAQIRALCEADAVAAENTPGGQWRIPTEEVERLKRDGLPPIPRPLPDGGTRPAMNGHRRTRPADHELLADPSDDVVSAFEEVRIAKSQLEKRRVEKEREEVEDWFRDRDRRLAEEEAEHEREERARQAAERAEHERTAWLRQWEDYALSRIHPNVPAETRLAALEAVRSKLEPLVPPPGPGVTKEMVDATLELALGQWLRFGDMRARLVKKFMQHTCNTSITRRGARGSLLGFWAFAGQPFPTGTAGHYLSLGGFFRCENDR